MSDVCVMCTWYTLSAGAPDDRPAPRRAAGPHRAFAGFGPRGPFSLAFGVRAVSAVSGPGPAAAGELAAFSYPRVHVDTHSSNPCVRVVTQCNDA